MSAEIKNGKDINQAKLLNELKNIMDLDEGEIASKLAISKKQVTDEIRGYIALEQYMKTLKEKIILVLMVLKK